MKIYKKLLILFIVIINCIQVIICGAQMPNNKNVSDRLEKIKERVS